MRVPIMRILLNWIMWLQAVFIFLIAFHSLLAHCQFKPNPIGKIICKNPSLDDYVHDVGKTWNNLQMASLREFSIVNSDLPLIDEVLFQNVCAPPDFYYFIIKINFCHVSTISRNAFANLTNISNFNLDLAFNEIEDLSFILGLPSKLQALILKNNKISHINFRLFKFPVETLDLSFNKIKEIDLSPVRNFPVLGILNLNNNQILTIGPTLNIYENLAISLANNPLQYFKNCERRDSAVMGSINLSNSLNFIPLHNTTQCINSFRTLILRNNNLTLDSSMAISSSAKYLDFSNSSITHIPRHIFQEQLFMSLNLSYNNLQRLSGSVFFNTVVNGTLDLSQCKIKNVNHLFKNLTVGRLNLRANSISELNSNSFNKIFGLYELNLSFNNNLKLKNNSFINCRGLLELMLHNSNISVIKKGAFNGLTSLKLLYLENNYLQTLPSNVFTPLISIKEIQLQNNRLDILRSNVFSSIPLRFVDLSDNNIKLINPRAFHNLTEFFIILIPNNNNSPLIIKKNAFSRLPSLVVVNITNSGLSRIHQNMFYKTSNIDSIDITNNNISSINFVKNAGLRLTQLSVTVVGGLKSKSFSGLKYLTILNFQNSKIGRIERGAFQGLPALRRLVIKNSKIELLEDGAFSSSFKVEYVRCENMLSKGGLRSFKSQDLRRLDVLDLSHQRLQSIAPNAFKGLYNLRYLVLNNNRLTQLNASTFTGVNPMNLDISYNRLTFLGPNTFRELDALTILNLNNNLLSNLEPDLFQHLRYLQSLNLKGNILTNFSVGTFSQLYNLQILQLAQNNISNLNFEAFLFLRSLVVLNLDSNDLKTIERYDLISNLKHLKTMGISKNKWHCEYLQKMLIIFRGANIERFYFDISPDYDVTNVDGIECICRDICQDLFCLNNTHVIN